MRKTEFSSVDILDEITLASQMYLSLIGVMRQEPYGGIIYFLIGYSQTPRR